MVRHLSLTAALAALAVVGLPAFGHAHGLGGSQDHLGALLLWLKIAWCGVLGGVVVATLLTLRR
jgi:hypothetical protein